MPESPNSDPLNNDEAEDSQEALRLPEKVTMGWMISHVPVQFWFWAAGALITTFTLGVFAGQTTFVRELFGKNQTAQHENKLLSVKTNLINHSIPLTGLSLL